MEKLSCIVLNEDLNLDDNYDKLSDYNWIWQLVLNHPLVLLPGNKIIFWGFKVKILKNEYDLLKTIIDLNTNAYNKDGYSEEQLIENIEYSRRNFKIDKNKTYQRFIITSISRIKKQIVQVVVQECINLIKLNCFNPFIDGRISAKSNFTDINSLKEDKTFKNKVLIADINLIKIFPHLPDFINVYDKYYSSFVLKHALKSLIRPLKGQKKKSAHRFYQSDFIFNKKGFDRDYKPISHLLFSRKPFNYAKTTPAKFNLANFVNYKYKH